VLFAYARPDYLRQTLDCLRENNVPLIFAFADSPQRPEVSERVREVRYILRTIDWCEVHLVERTENLGLGKSILTGVTKVFQKHEAIIVFEDDLICVPGTYKYLCAALEYYIDTPNVMSVTGWTHPLVTPGNVGDQPYFDGRAECLVWGTWARAWHGMEMDAKTLMRQCLDQGIDIYKYGADLVDMAKVELKQNIWAVRFLYWHILNRGLCLRPPWSMVEHIGFDAEATNAKTESWIKNPPLKPCPPIPEQWPDPVEHLACGRLHQKVYGTRPTITDHLYRFVRRLVSKVLRVVSLR
jgi:hypothetical protein